MIKKKGLNIIKNKFKFKLYTSTKKNDLDENQIHELYNIFFIF